MQRTAKNITHGSNAMVKEVKISRIIPEQTSKQNISHIYPDQLHPINEDPHHTITKENKKDERKKNKLDFNKLLDINKLLKFAKGDEFIILAVIFLLIIEGTGDIILLIALGYLLISDK